MTGQLTSRARRTHRKHLQAQVATESSFLGLAAQERRDIEIVGGIVLPLVLPYLAHILLNLVNNGGLLLVGN